MPQEDRPQINASKIVFGGGMAGLIFTLGSMAIFLAGLPVLWYMFPAAIVLGCGVALLLRSIRHKTPGSPWLLSAIEGGKPDAGKAHGHGRSTQSERMFIDNRIAGMNG